MELMERLWTNVISTSIAEELMLEASSCFAIYAADVEEQCQRSYSSTTLDANDASSMSTVKEVGKKIFQSEADSDSSASFQRKKSTSSESLSYSLYISKHEEEPNIENSFSLSSPHETAPITPNSSLSSSSLSNNASTPGTASKPLPSGDLHESDSIASPFRYVASQSYSHNSVGYLSAIGAEIEETQNAPTSNSTRHFQTDTFTSAPLKEYPHVSEFSLKAVSPVKELTRSEAPPTSWSLIYPPIYEDVAEDNIKPSENSDSGKQYESSESHHWSDKNTKCMLKQELYTKPHSAVKGKEVVESCKPVLANASQSKPPTKFETSGCKLVGDKIPVTAANRNNNSKVFSVTHTSNGPIVVRRRSSVSGSAHQHSPAVERLCIKVMPTMPVMGGDQAMQNHSILLSTSEDAMNQGPGVMFFNNNRLSSTGYHQSASKCCSDLSSAESLQTNLHHNQRFRISRVEKTNLVLRNASSPPSDGYNILEELQNSADFIETRRKNAVQNFSTTYSDGSSRSSFMKVANSLLSKLNVLNAETERLKTFSTEIKTELLQLISTASTMKY